jgi:hypothetical protein
MKIIKNYLDKNTFNNINNIITQSNFPWYFTSYISYPNDNAGFMFNHIFYNENGITSNYFNDIIFPLLTKIKFNRLLRAKANLYTQNLNNIKHNFHIDDTNNKHQVALYSLNTNDGYTEFEDGKIFKSIANSICLFDGNLKHRSITQTDKQIRLNININYQ